MTRTERLKRNILWIQLYYFFRSFIFAYVIERLFWRSRGISIAETVYIEIIYSIVLVVMEVPTGVWADRLSRKLMIMLGSIFTIVGAIWILNAYGFMPFAIIIALSGVSGALTSGSVSALLYDSLKEIGETLDFEKYLSRIKALRYGSGLLAALIGAFLASKFTLILPYQLSVVSCIMMFVMTCLLTEPKKVHEVEERLTAKEILQVSRSVIKSNRLIQYIFIVGATIGAAITYIEEFWQNYMDAISVDLVYFGIISGLMSLVVMIAAKHTGKISLKLKEDVKSKQGIYTGMLLVSSLCFIGLFIIRHPMGLVFMLITLYLEALLDTLVLGDLHHQVESHYRATVESIYAMFANVMSMILGLLFAFASDRYAVFEGYLVIGCFILVILLLKVVYFNKRQLRV